jgi:peroxiredoxin (alkyl hydroperoxide reductase subunit C)
MSNSTNKKTHKQFGFKLLVIALLVGLIFTVLYVSERAISPVKNSIGENLSGSNIPADDLRDLKDIYLQAAKDFLTQGYEGIQLADSYKFNYSGIQLSVAGDSTNVLDRNKQIWDNFILQYGPIDQKTASYAVFGNQVKIRFNTKKENQENSFWMLLSYANYDKAERSKLKPVLAEAALIKAVSTDEAIVRKPSLWVGQKMTASANKDYMIMDALTQGKLGTVDLYNSENKKWKMIFFFPSAYTFVCPTECLGLKENFNEFQKLNVDIYAVSGDLINTLQAWDKTYFGGLPYTLVADPTLRLAEQFGFAKFDSKVPYRGTAIVDPDGVIRFVSAQYNDVGRNIEEYLRVITALQTPGLKPQNWHEGDAVIIPE